ncbi:MAG TPA: alpha-galactosidase [Ilumatobacteraceae bacterium]|nr:alpha-galactosidase [Ilumatobacteraceae bacterium]
MIHLRGRASDVVVDVSNGPPAIVYWGPPLGSEVHDIDIERPLVQGSPDVIAPVAVVPEHASGFAGHPGLLGHRADGRDWAPRFVTTSHQREGNALIAVAHDHVAGLQLEVMFEIDHALVVWAQLRNDGDSAYILDELSITLPLPQHASELGSFTGRWSRELQPVRIAWPFGSSSAENRRGRTSHERPPLIFAGTPAFDEWEGSVWGAHVAWSGNHRVLAERLPDGRRYLQLGELLHPGELRIEPGQRYRTPEVIAVHSDRGLTAATQQFHRHLRARPTHPKTPRPVLLNTWEAVYFHHDLETLRSLADRAARIGIERFVLDDGWFGSRRDDTSGLGDWVVSVEAHPAGLTPLIEHVTGLGMEFGIWVEPEMVNPDSDLYRAHPEWALTTNGYEPVLARNQLVLDLARPDAFRHVLSQLDALLGNHDITYVKWDMNRDHIGGSGAGGAAGTHEQTHAVYRLLDELRELHPGVEIESCSSGGARIDHEILRRTERVWTSDCNDALERQTIQRGASMLIPAELMGAHIGPARAHTTGRRHDLAFRAATAMFGHLGVEWNLLTLDARELDDLASVIALHKQLRPLLHHGDTVRFDCEPSYVAHGVYSADRAEGLVSFAVVATAMSLAPPPLRLPGLDADRTYRITHLRLPGERLGPARVQPSWLADGASMSGAELAHVGLQPPSMHPETAILVRLVAAS